MKHHEDLYRQRDWLKREISTNLDFIMGTITAKGPRTYGYNLTTKVEGKSVSLYVPKALVETVRAMNQRHLQIRARMVELSRINYEILKLEASKSDSERKQKNL